MSILNLFFCFFWNNIVILKINDVAIQYIIFNPGRKIRGGENVSIQRGT